MASNEKDRLGDKLRSSERAREDIYFAEVDRRLIEEMKQARDEDQEAILREACRGRCPKCGTRLVTTRQHGILVEECPGCRGVWLDHGELELLAGKETDGWISRWLKREFPAAD